MRIDRLRIDAFGRFDRLDLELAPGLNVLHGPNETGKSTLLAFIRAVLFGFEKKSSPYPRYEPASGRLIGGELHLTTRQGRLIARRTGSPRRYDGQLTLQGPAGELYEEGRLADALGGISRDLYFQVFAFGLDELSSFEALAEQGGVSEALFAAGMQGAHRLPEAVKALRDAADALFTPRGQKPELSTLLRELDSTQAALRELGDRPADYFQKSERLAQVEAELAALEKGASALGARRDELGRLAGVLEDLSRLDRIHAELAGLPVLDQFPEGAVARLDELLDRAAQAHSEVAERGAEQGVLDEALEVLLRETAVAPHQAEVRAAVEAYAARAQARRALPARRAAMGEKRRQAEAALRGLGLGFDSDALLALELSERRKGELVELRDELAGARERVASFEERLRGAEAALAQLQEDQQRISAERDRLSDQPPGALRRQQAALARVDPSRNELRRLSDALRERQAQEEANRAQVHPAPREAFPLWLWGVATAAFLALAGAGAWVIDRRVAPWALGAAAFVEALLLLIQRRAARGFREALEAHREQERWSAAQLGRLAAEVQGFSRERAVAAETLASAAAQAGAAPDADAGALAVRAQELAEELRQVELRERLSPELDTLAARTARAEATCAQLQAELERARQALAEGERALAAWLTERSFPSGLSAEAALERWTHAAALQQRLLELRTDSIALEAEVEDCARSEQALREVARRCGVEAASADEAASALTSALEAERERLHERRRKEERRAEVAVALARGQRVLDEAERSLRQLLEQGGSAHPEELRIRDGLAQRYRAARTQARELSLTIEAVALVPPEEARARVQAAGGAAAVGEALRAVEQELAALGPQQKERAEERGALAIQLATLERDEQVRTLRLSEEVDRVRALALAERYAVDRLALSLLDFARKRHEDEHQPRLLQLASHTFETLTGGRYLRVQASPEGDRALVVRDSHGGEWSVERLSRGAREQLYLSLRLAVIEDFGQARIPLPVVLDDILVNFDPGRARRTVEALAALAASHQILAFTCHPYLEAMLREAGALAVPLPALPPEQVRIRTA